MAMTYGTLTGPLHTFLPHLMAEPSAPLHKSVTVFLWLAMITALLAAAVDSVTKAPRPMQKAY